MTKSDELQQLRRQAEQQHFYQVAVDLAKLPPAEQAEFLGQLPEAQAAAVFKFMDTAYQEEILHRLTRQEVSRLVEALDPDDRARLVEQMPVSLARNLLSGLSPAERRMTSELLGYPPESAGRYMTPEFLALTPALKVSEALGEVRRRGKTVETVYDLPVIADDGGFLGMVHLRDLVVSDAVVTLALFIPLLIDTGGNSGAQSATIMVRAMSVGEVQPSDFLRILFREAAVGLLFGACWR
ncbi:MAG: magnesium transporter [Deltaproteobacteria bacterium]|nr:magnesium transporter [Deltaproteobacteria bacterium]